jgi:hypothetical protein
MNALVKYEYHLRSKTQATESNLNTEFKKISTNLSGKTAKAAEYYYKSITKLGKNKIRTKQVVKAKESLIK